MRSAASNLAGSSLSVRFSHANAMGGTTIASLLLADVHAATIPEAAQAVIQYSDGVVSALVIDGSGTTIDVGSRMDDGFTFFHVREADGTIYFGASTDGETVVPIGSAPVPEDRSLEVVRAVLHAGKTDAAWGGYMAFDDVNDLAYSAAGSLCGASTLKDGFDDRVTDRMWQQFESDAACDVQEVSGVLLVTPGTGAVSCGYESWVRLRLTAEGVQVNAPIELNEFPSFAWMRLRKDPNNEIGIGVYQSLLHMFIMAGGDIVSNFTMRYDAKDHAFWKMHTDGDNVVFSASPDGIGWTEQQAFQKPYELEDMTLQLVGGNVTDVTSQPVIRFDQLNASVD